MIVVVSDTCIFIDLWNIGLLENFFELQLTVHTTFDVVSELEAEQAAALHAQKDHGKLTIHNLSHEQRAMIGQTPYPKSLSEPDKSVLHLATALNAMVLSSDKVLRHFAKTKNLDFHGMIWVVEQLVAGKHLTPQTRLVKLDELLSTNNMMRGSKEVKKKIDELKLLWTDQNE
jgi:predicted nucleic acid-binding protein